MHVFVNKVICLLFITREMRIISLAYFEPEKCFVSVLLSDPIR